MNYAICFDFPGADDPVFAGWISRHGGTRCLGHVPSLADAFKFVKVETAELTLEQYGDLSRAYGVVVEVAE